MYVVSNSTPLIYLAALGDFELLRSMFSRIHIPRAVWIELVDQGGGQPGHHAVVAAVADRWLHVETTVHPPDILPGLDPGELYAIQLAQEHMADALLMDDRRGVNHARQKGLVVVPTLALYIRAKWAGHITSVAVKARQLRAAGFRLSESDFQNVLTAAGES